MNEVLKYLKNKLKPNDVIILATSGGADSMCLLNLCLTLKDQYNLTLIVAHVNHKLRLQSEEEAEFVESYAKKYHLIYEYHEIKEYNQDNLESYARQRRYAFLNKLVLKYHANYLMTAHHGDDLIETIMMRLVRGSSLKGYAGIQKEIPMVNYELLRPLLSVTKKEIEDYMAEHSLKYYVDASNYSDEYTRNRYRKYLLPFLKKENPQVHQKFYKFSQELTLANNFITNYVTSLMQKYKVNGEYEISTLQSFDDFILRKLIEEELRILYPTDLFLVSDKNTTSIIKLIRSSIANGSVPLPKDFMAIKSYNKFKIGQTKNIKDYNLELTTKVITPLGKVKKVASSNLKSNYCLRLNSQDLKLPLIVRSRHIGDKMVIKNLNGSKKIKDILIDAKIPQEKRDLIPIVTDSANNILWICGVKKSQFDIPITGIYDIILLYEEENI